MSALPPYLRDLNFPVVFRDGLNQAGWELDKLSFEALAKVFHGKDYQFRLGRRDSEDIVWEGEFLTLLPLFHILLFDTRLPCFTLCLLFHILLFDTRLPCFTPCYMFFM